MVVGLSEVEWELAFWGWERVCVDFVREHDVVEVVIDRI